jgi:hypothetical protein
LEHLRRKLRSRDPKGYEKIRRLKSPDCHPAFKVIRGKIELWERV